MLSSKPKPSSLVALAQQYEKNSQNRHQSQKFNAGEEIEIRHGRVRRYHQPQRQPKGQNFDTGDNIEIYRGDYSASHAQSQQQRDRKGEVFDHDEVIQLSQVAREQSTDRSIPKPEPTFDEAETLAWDEAETPQTWGASLAQDDSYQVESFTSDEESKVKPESYQKEESSVRSAKKPSEQNLETKAKTPDPAKASTADQKIEIEDQDFLADLQAILNGDKTYEAKPQPPSKVSASPSPASPTPVPPSPHAVFDKLSQTASTAEESPHAIFERMGKNVAHAKAFDLGTVVLEQRLDKIEQQLDEKEARLASKATAKREVSTDQVQQLSEEDLVQDLSLIQQSVEQPESPKHLDEEESQLASQASEAETDSVEQLSEEDFAQDLSLIQQNADQQELSSTQDNVTPTEEMSETFGSPDSTRDKKEPKQKKPKSSQVTPNTNNRKQHTSRDPDIHASNKAGAKDDQNVRKNVQPVSESEKVVVDKVIKYFDSLENKSYYLQQDVKIILKRLEDLSNELMPGTPV